MILFVGDADSSLAKKAKEYDNRAFLINQSNVNSILDRKIKCEVAYTSFADLPKISEKQNVFFDVLNFASKIYYNPPVKWSDYTNKYDHWSMQRITEYFLWEINREKNNVYGLSLSSWVLNPYVELVDKRKNDSSQLWIAGCSIPHGVGVKSTERFGLIIADRLKLPVSHLTRAGSSISWAADQILRSDMRPGDLLVWAITTEYRFSLYDDKLKHLNPYNFHSSENRSIGNNLEDMLYKSVISIHQVINFCEKNKVGLILLPTISSEALKLLFHDCPNWFVPKYRNGFVDIGSDGMHPGPLQHALWAEFCVGILNNKLKPKIDQ